MKEAVNLNILYGRVEVRAYLEYTAPNKVVGMRYSIHYDKDNKIQKITEPTPTGIELNI